MLKFFKRNITRLLTLLTVGCVAAFAFSITAKQKSKDFVVVIDAGHGGKDVGAEDNGVLEKDINLQIAKRLEENLKKKKGYKVIMTRTGDKAVTLKERAEKANKAKADLFISIHCNSLDQDNANRSKVEGAMTFTLGPTGEEANRKVARRENMVIEIEKNKEVYENYDPDSDESHIAFEMAHREDLNRSIGLAELIQKNLLGTAGRQDRGVQQAGFLVLRETAMPAVLVECDFLCNANSAKYLGSSSGQKKIAQGIATAVVQYREQLRKYGDRAFQDVGEDTDSGEVFVLRNRQSSSRRTSAPTASATTSRNRQSTQPRRRRSAEARRASAERNLATDHIEVRLENEEPQGRLSRQLTSDSAPAASAKKAATPAPATNETKNVAKKENKKQEDKKDKKKEEKKKDNKNNGDEEETRIVNGHKVVISHTEPGDDTRSLKSRKENGTTQQAQPSAQPRTRRETANKAEISTDEISADDVPAEEPDEKPAEEVKPEKKAKHQQATKPEKENKHQQAAKNENEKKYQETIERKSESNPPRSLKSKRTRKPLL